jgi:molecular chaperone HtpG
MQTLRGLEKAGIVAFTEEEALRISEAEPVEAVAPIVLNEEQQAAFDRILELNVEHAAFAALENAVAADPEKAKKYSTLLYNQALLIAGLPLEDPSGYTDLVCELMI